MGAREGYGAAVGAVSSLAAIGVVASGVGIAIWGDAGECIQKRTIAACFGDPFSSPTPSVISMGGLKVESEKLTGTAQVMTYGEVTMEIGGQGSKFDWNSQNKLDKWGSWFGGTDATLRYNVDQDGKPIGSTEVKYNPCITLGDSDANKVSAPTSGDGSANYVEPPDHPSSSVSYKIDVEGGNITGVDITAGALDACFTRITGNPKNAALWSDDGNGKLGIYQVHIDDGFQATAHTMQDALIRAYAAANACPEAVSNTDDIKSQIAKIVLGQSIADHKDMPQLQGLLTKAYNANLFHVNLEDANVARERRQQEFNNLIAGFKAMKSTFPDAQGQTEPLEPVNIGTMTMASCNTSSPIEVKPTN